MPVTEVSRGNKLERETTEMDLSKKRITRPYDTHPT